MTTTSTLGLHLSFDPATLPLLSTSLGLFYAIIEPTIFVPFLRSSKTYPTETRKVTQVWWSHFFTPGMTTILSIGIANLAGGIYTLRTLRRGTQEFGVAAAGLGFAMGHFLWGPRIAGIIEKLCSEEVVEEGSTMEYLERWLSIHAWRTFLADVPAVACFAWLVFRT